MVKHLQDCAESLYGFPMPTPNQFPIPIAARRAPAASDTGYMIGQVWVNRVTGTAWVLAGNGGGVAVWLSIGGSFSPTVANVTVTGTATALHFETSTAATSTDITGNIWSAIGTNPAISLVLTPKGTGAVTVTTGDIEAVNGDVVMATVGKGLVIANGANARMNTATLVAGTILVPNTSVTATSYIFLQNVGLNASTAVGVPVAETIVAGVSFTINSYSAAAIVEVGDASTVQYLIVESI